MFRFMAFYRSLCHFCSKFVWRKNDKYEVWLKQITSLPRHDNIDDKEEEKDDNDYDEADYGKDDEDDASLEAERDQFSDICLCMKLSQTNNHKRQKPQTYKRFSSCS